MAHRLMRLPSIESFEGVRSNQLQGENQCRIVHHFSLAPSGKSFGTYRCPSKDSSKFLMESCAMRHRLQVRFWGFSISAEGIRRDRSGVVDCFCGSGGLSLLTESPDHLMITIPMDVSDHRTARFIARLQLPSIN
jgi:hypothetical protein